MKKSTGAASIRGWLAFMCFGAAVILFAYGFSALLIPHRTSYGATWGSFAKEAPHSLDGVFFGSSIVYCNIIPAVLYEETGAACYLMAGPEQTLPMTYYYVKEVLRTQSPKLVAVEVTGAYYREYEGFTKVNIGYMPWSLNRLAATFETAEPGLRLGLLFPLYNYHDRWPQLSLENLRYSADPYAGYTLLTEHEAQPGLTQRAVTFDEGVFEENLRALEAIADLCRAGGSRVLFFIAPTYYPWEQAYRDLLAARIEAIEGADYIDFNQSYHLLGIDAETDYYDMLHFNVYGAIKYSRFLAQSIRPYLEGGTRADRAIWDARVAALEPFRQ